MQMKRKIKKDIDENHEWYMMMFLIILYLTLGFGIVYLRQSIEYMGTLNTQHTTGE